VSCRRLETTIDAFREVLPKNRARRVLGDLRRIRRRAGVVREIDVHRKMLADAPRDGALGPALDAMEVWLDEARGGPEARLVRFIEKRSARLGRDIRRLSDERGEGYGPDRTLGEVEEIILGAHLDAVARDGERDLTVIDNLHRLRRTGKKLRYAMELFVTDDHDAFHERYADVRRFQDALGAINDHGEIAARLRAFVRTHPEHAAVLERAEYHEEQVRRRAEAFVTAWRATQCAEPEAGRTDS
jgi:CHAD domain-containing protein